MPFAPCTNFVEWNTDNALRAPASFHENIYDQMLLYSGQPGSDPGCRDSVSLINPEAGPRSRDELLERVHLVQLGLNRGVIKIATCYIQFPGCKLMHQADQSYCTIVRAFTWPVYFIQRALVSRDEAALSWPNKFVHARRQLTDKSILIFRKICFTDCLSSA